MLAAGPGNEERREELPLLIRLALIWALALAPALALWALVSPLGASPDEPAHIGYAWGLATAQDVFTANACEESDGCILTAVEVPEGLVPSPGCHAFDRRVSASCQLPNDSTVTASYMTRYPPPYYLAVGVVMRIGDGLGLGPNNVGLLGRLFSGVLGLTLLAPALALAGISHQRVVPAVIALLTPMTMFMTSSINPNGPEICAGIAVAVALVTLGSRPSPGRSGFFLYALFWLALSRPLGVLWAGAVLVFGLGYLHAGSSSPAVRETLRDLKVILVGAGLIMAAAMGWFVFATRVRSTSAGAELSVPDSATERALALFLRWGGMMWENLGVLGWLDTPMPQAFMLGLAACLAALVVVYGSDAGGHRRRRLVSGAYLAAIVLGVWAVMYRQSFLWQGRYALAPLTIALVLWAGAATEVTGRASRRIANLAWLISTSGALWLAARYSYGLRRGARYEVPDLSQDASWLGPLGSLGTVVVYLVSMASVPLAIWYTRKLTSRPAQA